MPATHIYAGHHCVLYAQICMCDGVGGIYIYICCSDVISSFSTAIAKTRVMLLWWMYACVFYWYIYCMAMCAHKFKWSRVKLTEREACI